MDREYRQIIFFDGSCALCNRYVLFLLRRDRAKNIYFSPLQGKTIHATAASPFAEEDSIVFCAKGYVYLRSSAIIHSIAALGGMWKGMQVLLCIPTCIRDAIYRYIAKNRYGWFGKNSVCPILTEEERHRFLE